MSGTPAPPTPKRQKNHLKLTLTPVPPLPTESSPGGSIPAVAATLTPSCDSASSTSSTASASSTVAKSAPAPRDGSRLAQPPAGPGPLAGAVVAAAPAPELGFALGAMRIGPTELDEEKRARFQEFIFNKSKFLNLAKTLPSDFVPIKMLGSGNGGVVWKITMARKMIHLEIKPKIREHILRELRVLHECNSPEIVGFFGSFYAEGEINLLMEYMDGGSLDRVLQRVGRVPEPVIGAIAMHVINGLLYLQEKLQIVHRDVKPSNILVNRLGEVKLCDFGVSGELVNSLAISFVGTRSYMAPERLLGNRYAVESDIWSLGLSLIELATGIFPVPADKPLVPLCPIRTIASAPVTHEAPPMLAVFELLACIVEGPPPTLPQGVGFSADFIAFTHLCLTKDPAARPSLTALVGHAWMRLTLARPADTRAWAVQSIPPDA